MRLLLLEEDGVGGGAGALVWCGWGGGAEEERVVGDWSGVLLEDGAMADEGGRELWMGGCCVDE